MIDFSQYLILFVVSTILAGFCVLAYDKIIVGKVPYKLLQEETIQEILSCLQLEPKQTIVDLGCGDGRVLIEAVRLQPKLKCIGVEKAVFPYLLARYKTKNYKNIKIFRRDVRQYDIAKSDIVFAYLLPSLLNDLAPNFRQSISNDNQLVTVQYKPNDFDPSLECKLKNKSEFADRWYLYHN
jgi:trans-aconitate methyltransferase